MSLVTKVAVVTGAARGIGLAITHKLLNSGYAVSLWDIDAPTLGATATAIAAHDRILPIVCDVSQPANVATAVAQVEARFGRLDALVNNAGVAIFKPLLDTTFDEWNHVMGTNLNGPFLCTLACAPVMLRGGGGSVVNIASISGVRASTLRVVYGTSKAAIIHLTKQQAVELGVRGIRVNCVAPGPVDTEMAKLVDSADIFPHELR